METPTRPRVVCVDDEPEVLNGLTLHLRRKYEVETANNGEQGLATIAAAATPVAVVISDMRMPGMNGAEFLSRVRERFPDTTRLLLTGQADVVSAAAAINEGQIFRFLTKPCPPPSLLVAVEAAVQQYRLVTNERVLLEQTLQGCVQMLIDVLALTSPAAFGRANRIRKHVGDLTRKLGIRDRWQVEVAGMLSQIGLIILPPETIDRLHYGVQLTPDEDKMVARAPATADQLLAHIPRLEGVRRLLAEVALPRQYDPDTEADPLPDLELGVEILRVAMDYDALENVDNGNTTALATLLGRKGRYHPRVLQAFAVTCGDRASNQVIREVAVSALAVGMILAQDLRMTTGTMLVTRGYEITASFLQRIRNFRPGTLVGPVKVRVTARA